MVFISDEIKDRIESIDIEQVASELGLMVKNHKALCFAHDDRHASLHFERNKKIWKCFACDISGKGVVSLVMAYNKCDYVTACLWLCEKFNIAYLSAKTNTPIRMKKHFSPQLYDTKGKAKIKVSETYYRIARCIVDTAGLSPKAQEFLFAKRILDPKVVEFLRIGSISDPQKLLEKLTSLFSVASLIEEGFIKQTNGKYYLRLFTPCLLFPYYDDDGNIMVLQTRYIGEMKDAPRFQFIGGRTDCVYNLPLLQNLCDNDDLYISEGVTDCLSLLSDGKNAVAIPSAGNIPERMLDTLAKFKLHMYPDNDEPGINAFMELRHKLMERGCYLWRETLPDSFKDYSEYYIYKKKHGEEGTKQG